MVTKLFGVNGHLRKMGNTKNGRNYMGNWSAGQMGIWGT